MERIAKKRKKRAHKNQRILKMTIAEFFTNERGERHAPGIDVPYLRGLFGTTIFLDNPVTNQNPRRITTVAELVRCTPAHLHSFKGVGAMRLKAIKDMLASAKLRLAKAPAKPHA